jgi:hypothetical protein
MLQSYLIAVVIGIEPIDFYNNYILNAI